MRRLTYYVTLLAVVCLVLPGCLGLGRKQDGDSAGMIEIPRGWFKMGLNRAEMNEAPEHDVYLDSFLIDKYEVTAKDFAEFLNAKGNPDDEYFSFDKFSTIVETPLKGDEAAGSVRKVRYEVRKGFENYPANNVSWVGADAYCRAKGKRLPTEAEWEKAARGTDQRIYPWGDTMPDGDKARYDRKWEEEGLHVMVPVQALPGGASYYGVVNMAGNVWEWVSDWYRQNYCDFCEPTTEDTLDIAARLTGKEPARGGNPDPRMPPMENFSVIS